MIDKYADPCQIARLWPKDQPFLGLLGSESQSFVPLQAKRVSLSEIDQEEFTFRDSQLMGRGYMGVIPYDKSVEPIIYCYDRLVIFDRINHNIVIKGEGSGVDLPNSTSRQSIHFSLSLIHI